MLFRNAFPAQCLTSFIASPQIWVFRVLSFGSPSITGRCKSGVIPINIMQLLTMIRDLHGFLGSVGCWPALGDRRPSVGTSAHYHPQTPPAGHPPYNAVTDHDRQSNRGGQHNIVTGSCTSPMHCGEVGNPLFLLSFLFPLLSLHLCGEGRKLQKPLLRKRNV